MKKKIFSFMTAVAALCIGVHSASAGFVGMPLNLKAAIELTGVNVPRLSCQFYTVDVLTGPLLVKDCWQSFGQSFGYGSFEQDILLRFV
jgi:hypothetical protein